MTAEEILKQNNIEIDRLKQEKPMLFYNILKSMEEYAQQIQLPPVSEEEIRNMAYEFYKDLPNEFATKGSLIKGFCQGAKELRDRLPHEPQTKEAVSLPVVTDEEINYEADNYARYGDGDQYLNDDMYFAYINGFKSCLSRLQPIGTQNISIPTDDEMRQWANEYAKEHSSAPDKDCPEWIIQDYMAGAGQMREHLTGVG